MFALGTIVGGMVSAVNPRHGWNTSPNEEGKDVRAIPFGGDTHEFYAAEEEPAIISSCFHRSWRM